MRAPWVIREEGWLIFSTRNSHGEIARRNCLRLCNVILNDDLSVWWKFHLFYYDCSLHLFPRLIFQKTFLILFLLFFFSSPNIQASWLFNRVKCLKLFESVNFNKKVRLWYLEIRSIYFMYIEIFKFLRIQLSLEILDDEGNDDLMKIPSFIIIVYCIVSKVNFSEIFLEPKESWFVEHLNFSESVNFNKKVRISLIFENSKYLFYVHRNFQVSSNCPNFEFNYHSKYWMIYLDENSYFIMIVALFLRLIFQKLFQNLKNLDSIMSNIWTSLNFNKKVSLWYLKKYAFYMDRNFQVSSNFPNFGFGLFLKFVQDSITTRNIGWSILVKIRILLWLLHCF